MTYSEWLKCKKLFLDEWKGKRPRCFQCKVELKPNMEKINLKPTEMEKFAFYARQNRFKGKEEFFINDEWIIPTDEQYFEYIMVKVNRPDHFQYYFNDKADYNQDPRYWGVDEDSNFCSKQCGFDYGNVSANWMKKKGSV